MICRLMVASVLCLSLNAKAGTVRTIQTNDQMMKVINLSLGYSTILRFKERPKKIVQGNGNYFSFEFTSNDLAIQPLTAPITSNLFVYGEYGRVFGFILKVKGHGRYDDLVNIKWKTKGSIRLKKSSPKTKRNKNSLSKVLKLGKVAEAKLKSISKHKALGLYFLDLEIKNNTSTEMNLSGLKIILTRSKKPLKDQKAIIEKDKIMKGEMSKVRVIVKLKKKKGFTVNLKLKKEKARTIINGSHL